MMRSETGPGQVLAVLRELGPTTRKDLVDALGWSRMTVGKRLEELIGAGLVISTGTAASEGGRPAEIFGLHEAHGLVLGLDIGGAYTRLAIADLGGTFLAEDAAAIGLATGPRDVAAWADERSLRLLAQLGKGPDDVLAVGVGVPGPVDMRAGVIGAPLRESAWEGVRFSDLLCVRGQVQVVDRDVNLMAVAEHRAIDGGEHTVVLRVGMGISCAFVLDGQVYRGERGGVGVLSLPGPDGRWQRLDEVVSGYTIRERLAAEGVSAGTSLEILDLVQTGHPLACELVGELGESLGRALAEVVRLLNPSTVVVGGALSDAGEVLLAPLRRSVAEGAGTYALQTLTIRLSAHGTRAGTTGAVRLAVDALLEPGRVNRQLASGT
ncbi:ROK family transcriptional regulator [Arsenicicoccus dermatophilus]|uniref:ROK family transcriptional regulator n=1 Tax=Arsenicicoccus dermatophilus TaxID=1076331 RepID=UPI001F4C6639|nr:ROK family transcriptional regulator [Arsenicicoccus dermatophilus]MCH8613279.1 ROK family protein [Arsenicicoccus dermatophilus]